MRFILIFSGMVAFVYGGTLWNSIGNNLNDAEISDGRLLNEGKRMDDGVAELIMAEEIIAGRADVMPFDQESEILHRKERDASQYSNDSLLFYHNLARSIVATANRTLDMFKLCKSPLLADMAQEIADMCEFDPDRVVDAIGTPFSSIGENMYFKSGTEYSAAEVVAEWISGGDYYDFETMTCHNNMELCKAYKQVVWAATKYIGCGVADCDMAEFNIPGADIGPQMGIFVVCLYAEGGNIPGESPFQLSECPCPVCTDPFECALEGDYKGLCEHDEQLCTTTTPEPTTTTEEPTTTTMEPTTAEPLDTCPPDLTSLDTCILLDNQYNSCRRNTPLYIYGLLYCYEYCGICDTTCIDETVGVDCSEFSFMDLCDPDGGSYSIGITFCRDTCGLCG